MSDDHAAATPAEQSSPETERERHERLWELTLPPWRQWLNTFCENWIFAFIVAMAIRSFFLEAYRIPTASMEPMLLGEPAFYKADHVVVDRISHFFALPERWEVTVFQYPRPEVQIDGAVRSAIDDRTGERIDNLFTRPLAHRNFVKRCLVLPGDRFYISGGDLRLEREGRWVTASKPPAVQEAVWLPMYEHGTAEGYLPWSGADIDEQGRLRMAPVDGRRIRYTQPLINLYMKDGTYRVLPLAEAREARRGDRYAGDMGALVQVSMTRPEFRWTRSSGEAITGNVWHLDRWEVSRLTTADLDSRAYGRTINPLMDEQVGDVRIRFRPVGLRGVVRLRLREGDAQAFALELHPDGWRLRRGDELLVEGDEAVVDADWALVHVDDRLWVSREGEPLCEPIDTLPVVPDEHPTSITWTGEGELLLARCGLDRDLHYSREGFLRDITRADREPVYRLGDISYRDLARSLRRLDQNDPQRDQIQRLLRDQEHQLQRQKMVREQMLGRPLSDAEGRQAIGIDPETAITAPPGAYLLLGDNSPFSLDGRSWGWVPEANLRGEVLAVAFPRWKLVR